MAFSNLEGTFLWKFLKSQVPSEADLNKIPSLENSAKMDSKITSVGLVGIDSDQGIEIDAIEFVAAVVVSVEVLVVVDVVVVVVATSAVEAVTRVQSCWKFYLSLLLNTLLNIANFRR